MIINNPLLQKNLIIAEESKLPLRADGTLAELTAEDLKNVATIEDYAFYYSDALAKATLPPSVHKIKKYAFGNSSLFDTIILQGDAVKTLNSVTAFNGTILSDALSVNQALTATYKANSGCIANGTVDSASFGEANWNSAYHSGRLNNGTVGNGATTAGTTFVECYQDGFVGGTLYLYFKLAETATINNVKIYGHTRDGSVRGFPSSVNVYVGTAESHTSSTYSLGTASYTTGTSSRTYTISGSKAGNYVIIKFVTTNAAAVIGLSEVQIFGSTSTATCGIYIENEDLVDDYKAASNWSTYADLIKPISEYNG